MKLNLKGLSVEGIQHDEDCIFNSDFYYFNFYFDELPEEMQCEEMLSIDQIKDAYDPVLRDYNGIEMGVTSFEYFKDNAEESEWTSFLEQVAIDYLNEVNKDGNIILTPIIQDGRFTKLLKKLFN